MTVLKVRKLGDEIALVLDQEALSLLQAEVGDEFTLERHDDQFVVARQSDETARQTELARGILKRYRKTFEALAR